MLAADNVTEVPLPVTPDHEYEVALPPAVRVMVLGVQALVALGVRVTAGSGFTVTVAVAVAVQPLASVPVTV